MLDSKKEKHPRMGGTPPDLVRRTSPVSDPTRMGRADDRDEVFEEPASSLDSPKLAKSTQAYRVVLGCRKKRGSD